MKSSSRFVSKNIKNIVLMLVCLFVFTVGTIAPLSAQKANGPKNKYGLPYDPNAVIDMNFGGKIQMYRIGDTFEYLYINEEMDTSLGELHFIDNYTGKMLGKYDYKNQCWLEYGEELKSAWVAINEYYYESIDLSKTFLNRDKYGNAYNRFGHLIDPDAEINPVFNTLDGLDFSFGPLTANYSSWESAVSFYYITPDDFIECGKYYLKEQRWGFYEDMISDVVDVSQFYSSIDLSKTDPNLDCHGNKVRINFAKATKTTAEVMAAPCKNDYGLPYDPKAEFDWSINGTYLGKLQVSVNKWNPDQVELIYGTYDYGIYDSRNQCWIEYTDAMKNINVDLSKLYSSINLSITELNRDIYGNPVTSDTEVVVRTGYIGSNTDGKFLHFYGDMPNPEADYLGGYDVYMSLSDDFYAYFCKTVNGEQKIFACYNFSKQYWYYRAGYDGRPAVNGEKFNSSAVDPSKLYQQCDPRIDYNRTKPASGIEFADINEVLGYTYNVTNYTGGQAYFEPQLLNFDSGARLAVEPGAAVTVGKYTARLTDNYGYEYSFEKNGVYVGQYDARLQMWQSFSPDIDVTDKELSALFSEIDPSVNLSRLTDKPSDYSFKSLNPGVVWIPVMANDEDSSGLSLTNVLAESRRLSNGVNLSKYNEASGKPKVLLFFNRDYEGSKDTVSSIRDSLSSFDGVDLLLLGDDGYSQEEFRWEYGSSAMKMYFSDFTDLQKSYMKKLYSYYTSSGFYPFVVYIDSNNKIQYMEYAPKLSAADLQNSIDRFLLNSVGGIGVFYDSTAVADTSLKKLGKYTLTWSKTYVTFTERENGRDIIKACYNHSYQYWEYQAGKRGYNAGTSTFDASSVDLSRLFRKIDKSVKLSRNAPDANELKPLLAQIKYSGTKCSVGDIILQDGTAVSPKTYRANSRNPAIGVVAFFRDVSFPNSNDAGTQTGNIEDAVIIGAKRDIKALVVPEKGSNFYRDENFATDDMLSYVPIYDVMSVRVEKRGSWNIGTYTPESDTDGSNNYKIIKAAIDEASATNPDFKMFGKISYPAFEAAENYGKTNNISGSFRNGWYVPTYAELDYIKRNTETVNNGLAKINGADSFMDAEEYVAYVRDGENYYSTRAVKHSSILGGNTLSSGKYYSYNKNSFVGSGNYNYGHVCEPELVYFIRNYADIDAAYSGRPANMIASGTYGEKPEPNAVGDIVFSDGSATALRDGLILTAEQKKAIMAVGVYIGDGYIGDKGYLYVASVYRNSNALVINDELGQIVNGDKTVKIPIDYNVVMTTAESYYPFTEMFTDGVKIWESIKKSYSWATGEKDRNGDYIKGFLPFMYADMYGSGNMFKYAIKKGSAYNPDVWNLSVTRRYGNYIVTTPKLDGIYSSGWFIPSFAENKLAQDSFSKISNQFTTVTEASVGSCFSNRNLQFRLLTSGLQLLDSWEGLDAEVVFHKAAKVYDEDLSLSPAEYSVDRCYIGDVVLADGSFVRNQLFEPNPKNPVVGIVAFFKDKTGNEDFFGLKPNTVILGVNCVAETYNGAKNFATNYGILNNITGIYRNGWYLPSVDERQRLRLQEFILDKSLAKVSGYDGGLYSIWTSAHENADLVQTALEESSAGIEDGYWNGGNSDDGRIGWYTWGKNETYFARALHDYVEPERLVEYDNTPVTDRNKPYKVGDIVLSDGSIVSAAQYRANSRNPAVGVIAFFKDEKFPNSGDCGSRTGTKENAYIIGLKQKRGVVQWASSGAQGLSLQKELQSYLSAMGYGAANTVTFYPGSDNDGSDNWSILCAAVTDENKTGRYPAFEYAASYGKNAGITGSYSSGWYVPTIAELTYVYRNKRLINDSIELIDMTMCVGGATYLSSSQLSFEGEGTYTLDGNTGTIEYEAKVNLKFDGHGVLVIRPLSTVTKTPEQWSEPVVEKKTAANPVLKKSSGTLIGQKPYPDAVGDIIFSDGSATAFTKNLYLTISESQKKEAVAVAAFIGDGKIGEKGKIYGLSLSSKTCLYYCSDFRYLLFSSWNGGWGKNMIWSEQEIFDGPRICGCYPNGKIIGDNEDPYDKVSYFTGDVNGRDNWESICKADPYGAENSEVVYPAWDFVNNLGEGWYIGSTAELWMVSKNIELINNARFAAGYGKFTGSWSSSFSGNEARPAVTAGNGGFGSTNFYRDADNVFGLYAFDMNKNIFGNGNVSSASDVPENLGNGMVLVQGGALRLGSNIVTLSSFYICDHEVTQDEFETVTGKNPSIYIGYNKPVERLSWYDAIEYCNALSLKEGLTPCYTQNGSIYTCNFSANGYRLPTEAEWEYAARGGNKGKNYTYSGSNDVESVAWYGGKGEEGAKPVKTKRPNELGLYDMSGNVWEWCWDCWDCWYDDSVAVGHVLRGGCWYDEAVDCSNSARINTDTGMDSFLVGFRIVRSTTNSTQGSQNKQDVQMSKSEMVFVPGGTFRMGNAYGSDDERPVHSVTLSSFYICNHEVTQLEYFNIMGKNQSRFKDIPKKNRINSPVEQVSWYDAVIYCNMRSIKEGLKPCYSLYGKTNPAEWGESKNDILCDWSANGYRLLSEAEWEYAARGGQKSKGYEYSGSNDLDSVAWYRENRNYTTHEVKTKLPNELGLYDMSGNVCEWVWDRYAEYDGTSQKDPHGPASGRGRVSRGEDSVFSRESEWESWNEIWRGFRVGRTTMDL